MTAIGLNRPAGTRRATVVFLSVVASCIAAGSSSQPSPAADADLFQRAAAALPWEWNDDDATLMSCVVRAADDLTVQVTRPASAPGNPFPDLDVRISRGGRVVYDGHGHAGTTFVAVGNWLLVAEYEPNSDGCRLVGVDLTAGQVRWRTDLLAVGPIDHSKYRNQVIVGRFDPDHVLVRGKESAGRYVEIVDVGTGRTVGHKRYTEDHR